MRHLRDGVAASQMGAAVLSSITCCQSFCCSLSYSLLSKLHEYNPYYPICWGPAADLHKIYAGLCGGLYRGLGIVQLSLSAVCCLLTLSVSSVFLCLRCGSQSRAFDCLAGNLHCQQPTLPPAALGIALPEPLRVL